jgi:hypothetical protein
MVALYQPFKDPGAEESEILFSVARKGKVRFPITLTTWHFTE